MTYREIEADLFSMPEDCALCHCVSSDFALGAGIAKRFAAMGVKRELISRYPREWNGKGYCLITTVNGRVVANLVTKQRYFNKPTLETLEQALVELREKALSKIAMPKIGCGLDKLLWEDVSPIIKRIFADTDTEITVCFL